MSARDELFRRVAGAFIDEAKANALLDAFRDEVLAEEASRPVQLRKTGFMAVHPHGAGLMVESFVLAGDEFEPYPVDVAENTAQLTDVIARHFARLGGAR